MIARLIALFRRPASVAPPPAHIATLLAHHAERIGNRSPDLVAKVERVHTILQQGMHNA